MKILQIGDESDDSNSLLLKKNDKQSIDYTKEVGEKKQPSFLQSKNITEQMSRSKNKENIITKLLEEERLEEDVLIKGYKSSPFVNEEDESSISGTLTESTSETETSHEIQSQVKTIKNLKQNEVVQQVGQTQSDNSKTIAKQVIQDQRDAHTDVELAQESLQR